MNIKIRTITNTGKQHNMQTSYFDSLPSFQDLKSHFQTLVPWRNIVIKYDDEKRDEICVVDSDEGLSRFCEGRMVLSFFVCPLRGGRYEEVIKGLVQEGFPRGKCRGLLRKFNGDVELVRNALKEQDECEEVRVLVEEGVPRKMAVRLMKRYGDIAIVRDQYLKICENDALYSIVADRLYDEGYTQKKRCIRLLSRCGGDADKVKKIIDGQKRKREKSPQEFSSGKGKEKKRKRLLDLNDKSTDFLIRADGSSYTLNTSPDFFVEKIGRVYLDGNNMLYIEKEMRNLSIKGRTKVQAEKMLGNIALYFTQALNLRKDNFQMNVMFDTSSMDGTTDMNFEIISGKVLGFSTADDALVSLSDELQSEMLSDTLFVTSDIELQNRLTERGALIMKSKVFLKCAQVLIGEETYQAILQQQTTQL